MNLNIFDIIGPVMVGPSSSHTAGAVNIGRVARMLLNEDVKSVVISLHGSFAHTLSGHGTDKALVAGLMGFLPADERVRDAINIAEDKGMKVEFKTVNLSGEHPNTAILDLVGVNGAKKLIQCASVGGGNIIVTNINGAEVDFSCKYFTIVGELEDRPGIVGAMTSVIGDNKINIAGVRAFRKMKGEHEIIVIETDQKLPDSLVEKVRKVSGIVNLTTVEKL